ncbi:MAG: ABC transporter permease, partial [Phycisphaerales bacterium]
PALIVASLCVAVCFTGIMMFISTLGRTEQGVAGAGWAMVMPFAMVGGAMVPLMFMPAWLQRVGSVSPVKWAIVAFEQAIWRGGAAADMLVPAASLLAFGAGGLGLGVLILARRGERAL